jgi:hypothetical protein
MEVTSERILNYAKGESHGEAGKQSWRCVEAKRLQSSSEVSGSMLSRNRLQCIYIQAQRASERSGSGSEHVRIIVILRACML